MRRNLWQAVIALDQFANCFTKDGWADETLSAHAWRSRSESKAWARTRVVIDALFFWQPNHCEEAYESEQRRRHLPASYVGTSGVGNQCSQAHQDNPRD
jgi:hypothetical protein